MGWLDIVKKYISDDDQTKRTAKLLERQALYMSSPLIQRAMNLAASEMVQSEIKEVTELEKKYKEKVEDLLD